jgi:hypothetical protein
LEGDCEERGRAIGKLTEELKRNCLRVQKRNWEMLKG